MTAGQRSTPAAERAPLRGRPWPWEAAPAAVTPDAKREWHAALESAAAENLRPTATALSALHAFLALYHLLVLPWAVAGTLAFADCATAAALLAVRLWLGRRPDKPLRAHPVAAAMAAVAVLNGLLVLALAPGPEGLLRLGLLIVGVSLVVLSTRWFVPTLVLTGAGWALVSWADGPSLSWPLELLMMAVAVMISLVAHTARARTLKHYQQLRLHKERREKELERVTQTLQQREQLLQQQTLQLRMIMANAPVVLFAVDRAGVITLLEGRGRDTLGLDRGNAVGRSVYELFPDAPHIVESFRRALAGETTSTYVDLDGLVLHAWHSPVVDGEGQVTGVIGVATNITAQKRAEDALRESEARYRQMFENNQAVKWLVDPRTLSIVDANQAACDYYGYSLAQLRQMTLTAIDTRPPPYIAEAARLALEGRRTYFPGSHRLASGEVRAVEVYSGPIDVAGQRLVFSIIHDITDRKRAQDLLQESEANYRRLFAAAQRQAQELALLDEVRTALSRALDLPDIFRIVVRAIAHTFGYTQVSLSMLEGDTLVVQSHVGYERIIDRIPLAEGIVGRVARTGQSVLLEDVQADSAFIGNIEGVVSEVCVPLFDHDRVVGVLNVESTAGVRLSEADLRLISALGQHVSIAIEQARLYAEVRESEKRFRALIEHSNDLILIVDAEARILYVSSSSEKVLGCRSDDMVGGTAVERFHQDDRPAMEAMFERAAGHPGTMQHVAECRARRPDGSYRFLEAVAVNLLDVPAVRGIVVNCHDITERKQAGQALAAANAELEQALLNARELAVAADIANRAKNIFLANMSHEIRTPLSTVLGLTEMALATNLTGEQRQYLQQVYASGEILLKLLSDLLDLSKIEAGYLAVEQVQFDLHDLVRQAVSTVASQAAEKGLQPSCAIDPEVPAVVSGDPTRLRQVLLNLLTNAVKFTDAGEVGVQLSIEHRTADSMLLHFVVADTGIGIPREHLGAIFDAFTQADSSISRRYGGSGLGLAISRRLAEKLGGQLWADSDGAPGRGSRFHFTAPFSLVAQPVAEPLPSHQMVLPFDDARIDHLHILLAEDNPTNQDVIARMLRKQGWKVTAVEDGRSAVAQAAEKDFDLILMDVQMPELDGLSATAAIRANERTNGRHVPIAALTAYAMQGDRERCLRAGMDGYLPKPIRAADLFAMVDELTRDRRPAPSGAAAGISNGPPPSPAAARSAP